MNGENGKERDRILHKEKKIYYREHLPSPVQLAVNAKSRISIRFISQCPRWKRWPTLWVDRDTDSLHSDWWLTRLHDILLPLSDLIHLPTKKKKNTLSFSLSDVMQSSSELVTTSQAVPRMWKHIPTYMVCDLTKNQREKRCWKELKKSWANRGGFKLKDFKQAEVGRECKVFECVHCYSCHCQNSYVLSQLLKMLTQK